MAILLDAKYADSYQHKGISFNNLHRYEEAIKNFDFAILIYPKYAEAY